MTAPLPTFEDWLKENGHVSTDEYACPRCNGLHPSFAFVRVTDDEGNWTGDFECSECFLQDVRAAAALQEQADHEERIAANPWDCDDGVQVKVERNRVIERARWAVDPITSPLTEAKQAEFAAYIRALNRITVDFCCPSDVVWPAAPDISADSYS